MHTVPIIQERKDDSGGLFDSRLNIKSNISKEREIKTNSKIYNLHQIASGVFEMKSIKIEAKESDE